MESELAIPSAEFSDAEKFWALPHEARLAKVRLLKAQGDDVVKIIFHAPDNHLQDGRVSEIELCEVLADYVLKPSFPQNYEEDAWRRFRGMPIWQSTIGIVESSYEVSTKCCSSID